MYAVISTGGKQYKVSTGDEIFVEKLSSEEGKKVKFDVIAINADGENLVCGAPFVKDATVTGEVRKNGKAKKITVFTYKPKKGEKRKMGHRQPYSKVCITALKYKDLVESIKVSNSKVTGSKKTGTNEASKKKTTSATKKSTVKSNTTKKNETKSKDEKQAKSKTSKTKVETDTEKKSK